MQTTINNVRMSMRQACDSQGQALYDEREIRSVTDLLLSEICGLSRVDRILQPQLVLPDSQRDTLLRIAALLGQGVPVQQALGYEVFMGQRFEVTPDVLIPRPETAELVQWIVSDSSHLPSSSAGLNILDVGTGSGCIALSLARLINNSQVLALDLSTAALDVARRNACQQHVDNVQFVQSDILAVADNLPVSKLISHLSTACPPVDKPVHQHPLSTIYPPSRQSCSLAEVHKSQAIDLAQRRFDIIVSNPPYICQHEAAEMSSLVLQHEPPTALFVPDSDPLLFYRSIARFALVTLTPGGHLYFEINAAYGHQTCDLLRSLGFVNVELRQDVTGRDRMVRATMQSGAQVLQF